MLSSGGASLPAPTPREQLKPYLSDFLKEPMHTERELDLQNDIYPICASGLLALHHHHYIGLLTLLCCAATLVALVGGEGANWGGKVPAIRPEDLAQAGWTASSLAYGLKSGVMAE